MNRFVLRILRRIFKPQYIYSVGGTFRKHRKTWNVEYYDWDGSKRWIRWSDSSVGILWEE